MKVAEIVVKILESEGITAAFGIPGAGINPVYKHLGTSTKITHFTVRHEEAAVHAADGFFRASGKMALAMIPEVKSDLNLIQQVLDLLSQAKNPVMIMGGGVVFFGAVAECVEFAEYLQLPVITTYMSKGAFPDNHPLSLGCMRIQVWSPLGNKIFLERADGPLDGTERGGGQGI